MFKTIKHIISLCAITSLLALSFIGCTININTPETKYTVSFDSNGHGTAPASIPNLKKGDKVTEPDALTTEAEFTFGGWYKDTECTTKWDFIKDTVSSDITLYAKWTPWDKVADVTFSQTGTVDYKDTITLSCDTKGATIHYTVDNGTKKTSTTDVSLIIEKDCSISAYATKEGMTKSNSTTIDFTIKTYTVTFLNEKGDEPTSIPGLKKNSTLKPEQIKQLDYITGFDFAGWTVDGVKFDENYPITKDITVTANWKEWEKVEPVTFNRQSGEVDPQTTVTLTCGTEGAKIHYKKGFDVEVIEDSPCTIRLDSPCSITAWGTKDRMNNSDKTTENYTFKTYTVSYDTKGIVPQPESFTGWKGKIVTPLPNFKDVKGFTFDGWYNGETKITDNKITIENTDIKLTAKWIPHVILSTGETIRYDQITEDQKSKAIAVACAINSKGKLLGLGISILLEQDLPWANENTLASKHDFLESFIGDTDGSDNWNVIVNEYIKKGQTEQKALKDCPAFAWANNYGKTFIKSTDYQDGWYIPSVAEFSLINNHVEEIYNALIELNYIYKDYLKIYSFWTSTPLYDTNSGLYLAYISKFGDLTPVHRIASGHVCCIRVFE